MDTGSLFEYLRRFDKLPAAIDLMAGREKTILDAARNPGFSPATLRQAFAESDQIK